MENLNENMVRFINCALAQNKPYREAVELLDKNGCDKDLLDVDTFYKFLEEKGEELLEALGELK